MSNPNIVEVTSILGNNSLTSLTTTNATQLVSNPANSNEVYRVTSLMVSNVDPTDPYYVTFNLYNEDDLGGTAYTIVNKLTVPANSSIVVIDKNSSFYLKEDQSIGATAELANTIEIIASWEEIS